LIVEGVALLFEYTEPQTEFERLFGGFRSINAFGKIENDDAENFFKFLESVQPPPRTCVYINSTGGDVDAAIVIGAFIRERWLLTSVGSYVLYPGEQSQPIVRRELISGKCLSAATLMYLGGRLRYLPDGSSFGVHRFSYKNPAPDNFEHSQMLSAKIARYIAEMGITAEFLELSSSVASNDLKIIDIGQLDRLGIVTGGQTAVSWSVQAGGGALYVRGERDSLFGHHKVILGHAKTEGFFFCALIEAMGRENELLNFGLVEIVLNEEEAYRIDISRRCHREVQGIYVNVLSNISPEEAKLISYSEGFGVQIRASSEAEIFLGIAPMDCNGGKEQLFALYGAFT
jgi:hypothetical protein